MGRGERLPPSVGDSWAPRPSGSSRPLGRAPRGHLSQRLKGSAVPGRPQPRGTRPRSPQPTSQAPGRRRALPPPPCEQATVRGNGPGGGGAPRPPRRGRAVGPGKGVNRGGCCSESQLGARGSGLGPGGHREQVAEGTGTPRPPGRPFACVGALMPLGVWRPRSPSLAIHRARPLPPAPRPLVPSPGGPRLGPVGAGSRLQGRRSSVLRTHTLSEGLGPASRTVADRLVPPAGGLDSTRLCPGPAVTGGCHPPPPPSGRGLQVQGGAQA